MSRIDRSTSPELIRGFREQVGIKREELSRVFRVSRSRLLEYETRGAPAAFRYALAGLAVERGHDPWTLGLYETPRPGAGGGGAA